MHDACMVWGVLCACGRVSTVCGMSGVCVGVWVYMCGMCCMCVLVCVLVYVCLCGVWFEWYVGDVVCL